MVGCSFEKINEWVTFSDILASKDSVLLSTVFPTLTQRKGQRQT